MMMIFLRLTNLVWACTLFIGGKERTLNALGMITMQPKRLEYRNPNVSDVIERKGTIGTKERTYDTSNASGNDRTDRVRVLSMIFKNESFCQVSQKRKVRSTLGTKERTYETSNGLTPQATAERTGWCYPQPLKMNLSVPFLKTFLWFVIFSLERARER